MHGIALDRPRLRDIPIWVWPAVGWALLVVYALAFDQGLLERAVHMLGASTLHELFHDARHVLAVPCH